MGMSESSRMESLQQLLGEGIRSNEATQKAVQHLVGLLEERDQRITSIERLYEAHERNLDEVWIVLHGKDGGNGLSTRVRLLENTKPDCSPCQRTLKELETRISNNETRHATAETLRGKLDVKSVLPIVIAGLSLLIAFLALWEKIR